MAFPQQHEVHFPGNLSHAADAPRNATSFPPPHHPQSAPSPYPRSLVPTQLHGHAGVLRDAVVSNWRRDIPPFALTRTHILLVLFLDSISECYWWPSTKRGQGEYFPTCRKPCCASSTTRPTVR